MGDCVVWSPGKPSTLNIYGSSSKVARKSLRENILREASKKDNSQVIQQTNPYD